MNIYTRLVMTDSLRNFFLSALVPIIDVVLMLVFIHVLKASTWEKTFLGVLLKSGFVLSVPLSIWIFRKKFSLPYVLTFINLVGVGALLSTIFIKNTYFFLVIVFVVAFPLVGIHPLMAEFYSRYPKVSRGRRFAISGIALTIGSVVFAYLFRTILNYSNTFKATIISDLSASTASTPTIFITIKTIFVQLFANTLETLGGGYSIVALIAACVLLISTLFAYRLPKLRPKSKSKELNFNKIITILKKDKLFLTILLSWMLLGISNLWTLPYRTNYLSEARFGFNYSEERVIFLLIVLPQCVQLLMTIPMSYVFDKINFLKLRIILNMLIASYIVLFFMGNSYELIVAGMVLFGIARAGGSIGWKLWVNQIVPPSKVGTYMAIHSGFTGFRMVAAPFFGLWGLYTFGGTICGLISLILILISIVMLIPLLGASRFRWRY